MIDIRSLQEIIDILREEHLPKESEMRQVLADSEFNRGRVSAIYEIVDTFERLILREEEDDLNDTLSH